jgi:hypothetical protein
MTPSLRSCSWISGTQELRSARATPGSLGQDRSDLAIGNTRWCQKHVGDQSRPTEAQMQAKGKKGLLVMVILAIACQLAELLGKPSASKAADRHRHAIQESDCGIVTDQFIAQPAPQAFLDGPQIGGLSHKRGAMQVCQSGKEMRIVPAKVVGECLVLGQTQKRPHDFHPDDFTIAQHRHGMNPSFSNTTCTWR